MKLKELALSDVGKKVSIRVRDTVVTGVLRDIRSRTDWISEASCFDPCADPVPGRWSVTIFIGQIELRDLDPDSDISITSDAATVKES